MAIGYFWIVYASLYMHVFEYVCDQPPPTPALLIKVSSIVTHSNANYEMLTHTYHSTPAQLFLTFKY